MRRVGCKAIQMSDQKVCTKCGLRWDMNDPEPPECITDAPAPVDNNVEKYNQELYKQGEIC